LAKLGNKRYRGEGEDPEEEDPYRDDHVSVAFVTNVGVTGWIRLIQTYGRYIGREYEMPPESSSIELVGDITSVWVRLVEDGKSYDYHIKKAGDTDRGHKETPKETYNFEKYNFYDTLSEARATIYLKVAVDVDPEELMRRRGTNDDESSQVEPETIGLVTSIDVNWL
jgi:hypothetical protein